ncbi:MAG: hypothetical protein SPI77_01530 [Corynebacterium sp.]|nr:hypothetical protein [Corynebacterium sp.]
MALLYTGKGLTRLYYGTDTHVFGLGIGIVFAFAFARGTRVPAVLGWPALAIIIAFMLTVPEDSLFAYRGGMVGASLLVVALLGAMIASAFGGFLDRIPGVTLLAKSNRQWYQEPDTLAGELATGQVGRAVFICLGTNAGVTDINLVHQVVQMLGPTRIVMLVTLYSPSTFVADSNAALYEVADQYANVGVIDWNTFVSSHPEWLQVDETHPSIEGAFEFAQFIYDELQKFTAQLAVTQAEQAGRDAQIARVEELEHRLSESSGE